MTLRCAYHLVLLLISQADIYQNYLPMVWVFGSIAGGSLQFLLNYMHYMYGATGRSSTTVTSVENLIHCVIGNQLNLNCLTLQLCALTVLQSTGG